MCPLNRLNSQPKDIALYPKQGLLPFFLFVFWNKTLAGFYLEMSQSDDIPHFSVNSESEQMKSSAEKHLIKTQKNEKIASDEWVTGSLKNLTKCTYRSK